MIDIIITSYNEPKATLRAVKSFLNQSTGINEKVRVFVVDPFPEVEKFLKKEINDSRFIFFLDPGEGKAYALNILFQEYGSQNKEDLFILTDGDVHVSQNTLSEIVHAFKNKKVGCATGHPIALNPHESKYEYWAYIAFKGIHKTRKKLESKDSFFQCSGYLFAIRQGIILDFPLNVPEDSIIPYLIWDKGHKIKYMPYAKVYIKNPNNWKDWLNQKIRNIKAHQNLNEVAPNMNRTKSILNEIKEGAFYALRVPRSLKEFWWTLQLYFARLYIYLKAFKDVYLVKDSFRDGWRKTEIDSTRPLD